MADKIVEIKNGSQLHFWEQVVIAAVRAGWGWSQSIERADHALKERQERLSFDLKIDEDGDYEV